MVNTLSQTGGPLFCAAWQPCSLVLGVCMARHHFHSSGAAVRSLRAVGWCLCIDRCLSNTRRKTLDARPEGVVGIVIGLITFLWPGAATLALLTIIAAWAIITGVFEIIAAIRLRAEIEGEWFMMLSGLLSVLFGIALAVWPVGG